MILRDRTITNLVADGVIGIDPFDIESVQPASVDLHLGDDLCEVVPDFRISEDIDPMEGGRLMPIPGDDWMWTLEPSHFALGFTLETIRIPDWCLGTLSGKSSLARLGLQVHATGGLIDPGFSGQVVLELSNVNHRAGIILRTGMAIAQITFQRLDGPAERPYGHGTRDSRYQGQRGVVGSRYGQGRAR